MTMKMGKTFAILGAASALALGACGEQNVEPDPTAQIEEDPLGMPENTDMDTQAADVSEVIGDDMDEVDTYDVEGAAFETPRMQQGPTFSAAREQPLTEEQTARMGDDDPEEVSAEVTRETQELAAAGERLVDPATNGDASFAQLDRDGDGQLSVAEFAIYDLSNVHPRVQGQKDDGTRPYVSTTAVNMAMEDFARLDEDGDFFLDRSEFDAVTR
jgi:hypothetical protein|tara:strand:- start:127556 stop:128200 length:645 start_codon:yes stop_codon:yes gene_type:complete